MTYPGRLLLQQAVGSATDKYLTVTLVLIKL